MIAANAPKKKKKNLPAKEGEVNLAAATAAPAPATAGISEQNSNNPETSSSSSTSSEAPPVENINIMDKSETSPPAEEIVSSKPVQPETNFDQRLDQLIDNANQKDPTPDAEAAVTPPKKEAKSMADLIVEDDVYTPAPMYDQVGRGLVYNCKDKYWACIDKPAYVACNKNMKWNKTKGNAQECVVQNVYGSDEDCAKIQKYNISTNIPTSFCN
jgi:hypothetical protein